MKTPVWIVCGGTGGHVAPGIAVAQALAALPAAPRPLIILSAKAIDRHFSQQYPQFSFAYSPSTPLGRSLLGRVKGLWATLRAVAWTLRLIVRHRPQVVLGFGGFASGVTLATARLLGVRIVLHEANRVPGKVTRYLAPFAHTVYIPSDLHWQPRAPLHRLSQSVYRFLSCILPVRTTRTQAPAASQAGSVRVGSSAQGSCLPGPLVYPLGMPLRSSIRPVPKAQARAFWGLPPQGTVLGIVGGSQGAQALNDWVLQALPHLRAAGIRVLWLTGPLTPALSVANGRGVRTLAFCQAMEQFFSACDLVVARSGAGTLAECMACGTPSVLVPYPWAADQHQQANAQWAQAVGVARVVSQNQLSGLTALVLQTLADAPWLHSARQQCLHLAPQQAARQLAQALLQALR